MLRFILTPTFGALVLLFLIAGSHLVYAGGILKRGGGGVLQDELDPPTVEAAVDPNAATTTPSTTTPGHAVTGGSFVPFFKPAKADKAVAGSACSAATETHDSFLKQLKDSKRLACSIRNNKDLSAKVFEYLADFAGVKISVHQYVRVRSSGMFDLLEDLKCEEEDANSVYLTNSRGEHVHPEWLHSAGAAGAATKKSTKEEEDDDSQTHHFNVWEHGPGHRELQAVIRVDRAEPGNVLSNIEIAFNIFVATQLLKIPEFKLVFRDRASLYWGDMTVLQRLVKQTDKNLLYFDHPDVKRARRGSKKNSKSKNRKGDGGGGPSDEEIALEKSKHAGRIARGRSADALRIAGAPRNELPHDTPAEQQQEDDNTNGGDGGAAVTYDHNKGWKTPAPADPAADAVEFSNLIEFGGFPFTSVLLGGGGAGDSAGKDAIENVPSPASASPFGCPSLLLQSFARWYSSETGISSAASARENAKSKLRVLWCSRQPQKGLVKRKEMYLPARRLQDELQFLIDLADEMGTGVQLRSLDFGDKGDVVESVGTVREVDVFVGVHGAGLSWSMFMRPGESALVEVFTEDIGEPLAAVSPYRRIASLAGIAYSSARIKGGYHEPPFDLPFPGEQREIAWTAADVKRIASAILSLPFSRPLPETKEWCK